MRRIVRATLPEAPRLALALARRQLRDRLRGDTARIAGRREREGGGLTALVEVVQPIRNTAFLDGKLANIRLGAGRLDGVTIAPGEIFSFWALVGRPLPEAGFALGRSIRGGLVGGEVGGGLCQVSGIAYELLLRAGFEVLERYAHSRDLYSEAERFTPLGLDATVVWPYRDLRLANGLGLPVTIGFAVEEMTLRAFLRAPKAIAPAIVEVERKDHRAWREVRVSRDGVGVSHDRYEANPPE